ncbi:MAG: HlyD family type I secretion periplasmic adaptor subunit [Deltaproteobacteria bacterium]|nr:HlyD family type I secretion periplasmic adaptor subunit [Deltaproteobacteria bacterium]
MKDDYHDFKPILTEIEERPVNPLGAIFLWTIIAFMVVVLLGLYLVKVDVVVSARGKIIPLGDVKVVQPLETGVVTGIHVKEGDFVTKGAILLEIDPSIDKADLEGKERNLKFSLLAMERINAVLSGNGFSPHRKNYPQDVIATQVLQYRAQKAVYTSTLQEKEKEYRETQSTLNTLTEEIKKLRDLLGITVEDERRQKALVEIGALAENRYREKMKERMNLEREIDVKKGQSEQTATKLDRIKDEIETFKNSFREKLLSEFSTNMQGKNVLEAEVSNLRFKQEKKYIISPVSGYVHQLPVKTIGGVVTTAQPVVSLVPENTPLLVNALVFNKDIGFVKEGQSCVIKVDTFDFQKYGTVEGLVQTVNPFSLDEKGSERESQEGNKAGGYPVYVKMISEKLLTKDGTEYSLKPGMSVTAEINVGKRRVIEFFLFPIIKYLDEGLKVR